MSLLLFFDPPQDGFQGEMDEVAVYSTALSAARINAHYHSPAGAYSASVLSDSPQGYWRFEESAGGAIDSSTNAYNGLYANPNGVVLRQNSGFSISSTASNQIILYFREIDQAYLKNLDLDGGGWPMSRLNALGHQPDFAFGLPTYPPRTQADIDFLPQTSLDDTPQTDLEKLSTALIGSEWIEVNLSWNAAASTLKLQDTVGNGFTFTDLRLQPNQDYILFADLHENALRVRIYMLDHNSFSPNVPTTGSIIWSPIVYDTTIIVDDTFIKRRRGRSGFFARFSDGDAYLYNVRPRDFMFAEWRSTPLNSITPIKGAQVYAGGTPSREHFTGWFPGPHGGTIGPDSTKSTSGESFVVSNDGTKPLQGIATNSIYFDIYDEMEISFDLNFPGEALSEEGNLGLEAILYGEFGRIVSLNLPTIKGGKWQHVQVFVNALDAFQTGYYTFCLIQSLNGIRTKWYIDHMSVQKRSMAWAARGQINNAWGERDDGWIPFKDTVNDPNGGVVVGTRDKQLQVRGQAVQQNVYVNDIKVLPQYAGPGRFAWSDQGIGLVPQPTAQFVSTPVATAHKTMNFNGSTSHASTFIASYEWDFGDGAQGFDSSINHTYAEAGTYTVTLTVTDSQGLHAQSSSTVMVAD